MRRAHRLAWAAAGVLNRPYGRLGFLVVTVLWCGAWVLGQAGAPAQPPASRPATTGPATKPATSPATKPAPVARKPADAGLEPPAFVTVLDSASVWRVLHSWAHVLVLKDGQAVEYHNPKDVWDYRTASPTASWTALDFDDAGWSRRQFPNPHANGEFDARAGGGSTRPELRQLTLRGKFTVKDPSAVRSLWLTLVYRGGVVIHVNGREINRDFMPEGAIEPLSAAKEYPARAFLNDEGKPWNWYSDSKIVTDEITPLRVRRIEKLDIPPDVLRAGKNVLALEIHAAPQAAPPNNSFGWTPCGLIELRLRTEQKEAGDPNRSTSRLGTPVVPNVARPPGVQVWNTDLAESIDGSSWADPHEPLRPVRLGGARNGIYAARVMVTSDAPIRALAATVTELAGPGGAKLPASAVRIGYGAFDEQSGGRDDAILPAPPAEAAVRTPPPVDARYESPALRARIAQGLPPRPTPGAFQSVILQCRIPKDAAPGAYRGKLAIRCEGLDKPGDPNRNASRLGTPAEADVELTVADHTLPDPADFQYWYGLIQSPEASALRYGVAPFSDRHLELLGRSFELVAQTGSKVIFLPLIAESEYGNADSLVLWIKQPDGGGSQPPSTAVGAPSYRHDFSRLEKYLDVALKHIRQPRYIVCIVWSPGNQNKSPRATALDVATGQTENFDAPEHGTAEAAAFWKPVLTKVRATLDARGVGQAMLLGNASDQYPSKATGSVFRNILPDVGWETHRHFPNAGEEVVCEEPPNVPVRYNQGVWGAWEGVDPDTRRNLGWKYPYKVQRGLRCWLDRGVYDEYAFSTFRALPEHILLANRPGIGQVGADFWPHKNAAGKWQPIYGRYPKTVQSGGGNKACTTNQLLYPGPDGPAPSIRFQLTLEGIQDAENRILIEKRLDQKPPTLEPALVQEAQALLDDMARHNRLAYNGGPEVAVSWPYSEWARRSLRLCEMAGRVTKASPPASEPAPK